MLNLLKISRMWAVPHFVPEVSEKGAQVLAKPLKINKIDGAGRGNRTPMELLPTDFESAASASSAIPASIRTSSMHYYVDRLTASLRCQ